MANSSSCSSSTCLAQSITATHDFKVTNFSLLKGMGVGRFVSSSTFTAGACDWKIKLYPDGKRTEGHVSDMVTIAVPPSDLQQDFAKMLKDADGADVTINVGDRFYLAHTIPQPLLDVGCGVVITRKPTLER
ncbi:unnamed protein product [Urochloa humidicola]